jgi:hypothetical protein
MADWEYHSMSALLGQESGNLSIVWSEQTGNVATH